MCEIQQLIYFFEICQLKKWKVIFAIDNMI